MEAYNDMFLENSILQKENNNYRMKLKAMQVTNGNAESQFANTSLFSKLPGQETAKGLFGRRVKLPPAYQSTHTLELHTVPYNVEHQTGSCKYQFL